jgi:type III restriction enzyme
MAKHNAANAANARMKREYFDYLKQAQGRDDASIDQVASAIARFEASTGHKDFKKFHRQQAAAFKSRLGKEKNARTRKALSRATVLSILKAVRAFFVWLAGQPGYKSRFTYADADYFNLSDKDVRIAKASREKAVPTLDQVHHVLGNMPAGTDIEKRNRALIAFALLTGARVPARTANVLVEIAGRELEQEGMIKLPLNVQPIQSTDWQDALRASLDRVNALDASAKAYRADGGGYIRPILLVQAERTGAEQRDGQFIHADDVKAWLLAAGLDEAEVALKTSEVNDLDKPENADLLSPQCRVRVIITKAALQEGWDCPFAYVLCSLAASGNESAMTQLVGRILRQPHATRIAAEGEEPHELDQCYVFTHRADTAQVVNAIKNGLEAEGLGDLVRDVSVAGATGTLSERRKAERRDTFRQTHIALPKVLWIEPGQEPRELDPESDLFPAIDWAGCDVEAFADGVPENAQAAASQLVRVRTGEGGKLETAEYAANTGAAAFDPAYAVRMIMDLVPNPYVARELVGRVLARLEARGFDQEKLGALSSYIIDELRKVLAKWRDDEAAKVFADRLASGRIEFRIRGDGGDWIMPIELVVIAGENADLLSRATGTPLERSLFLPIFKHELNGEEQGLARKLDESALISWWHRNGTVRGDYALRGWRRGKVYPDFIFAAIKHGGGQRLVALESKGDQLDNRDTAYKATVLAMLTEAYVNRASATGGELELESETPEYQAAVVLFSDMEAELPKIIKR